MNLESKETLDMATQAYLNQKQKVKQLRMELQMQEILLSEKLDLQRLAYSTYRKERNESVSGWNSVNS